MGVELATRPTQRADAFEDAWSSMVTSWFGDGVWPGQLNRGRVYADATGLNVKIDSLKVMIQGFHGEKGTVSQLDIAQADPSNPRIDRIVARLNRTVPATISLEVITGQAALSPSAPVITRNNVIYDIPLARVAVGAGVGSIQADKVTDERVWATPRHNEQAGVVKQYLGTVAPEGYLLMAGQTVATADYPALALILGAAGTTMIVPDMRSRFARGSASTNSTGSTGGADEISLNASHLPTHAHSYSDPGHAHVLNDPGHSHTINQSAHGHGVSDPGHRHGIGGDTGFRIVVTASSTVNLATKSTPGWTNEVSFTNMDIAGTGISIQGANANVSNATGYTGQTVQGSYTGITIQNAGNSSPFSLLPSYRSMNFIVKAH